MSRVSRSPLGFLWLSSLALSVVLAAGCEDAATAAKTDIGNPDAVTGVDIDLNDLNLTDLNLTDINADVLDFKDIDVGNLDISLDGLDIDIDFGQDQGAGTDTLVATDVTPGTDAEATTDIAQGTDAQPGTDVEQGADALEGTDVVLAADAGADGDAVSDPDVLASTDTEQPQDTDFPADTTATTDDTTAGDSTESDATGTDAEDTAVAVDIYTGCTSAEACADANPCTTDTCEANGLCSNVNNTAPCSDGNGCTIADACLDGACLPGDTTICADDNVCTTDSCDGETGNCVFAPNQNTCDDGITCTYADICAEGQCTGTVGDAGCDDGNSCTSDACDLLMDLCVNLPQDATCSDDNVCTGGDSCQDGVCTTPELGLSAVDQGSYQQDGSYNVNPYGPYPGTAFGQFFVAGQSGALDNIEVGLSMIQPTVYGYQATFSAGTVTMTVYNADGKPLGQSGLNLNAIGDGDTPMSATAVNGTVFSFQDVYLQAGATYRFGLVVTLNSPPNCTSGGDIQYCSGTYLNVSNYLACTSNVDCVWPITLDTTSLVESYPDGYMYMESTTFPGPIKKEDDLVFKTVVRPAYNQALNGTACSDGLACTVSDACNMGQCEAMLDCNDNVKCTIDACTPEGCTYTADDKACSDGDTCTLEACDLAAGCTATGLAEDGVDCNDGNFCVEAATCLAGKCQETLKTCPDQSFCVPGICDKQLGGCTVYLRKCPSTGVCNNDLCDDSVGACVAVFKGLGQVCDDGNPCSEYSNCTPEKTCVSTLKGICAAGDDCKENMDCSSSNCKDGKCQQYSCPNGEQDLGEFGVDCGGICPIGCGQGNYCNLDKDCLETLACVNNSCEPK